MQINNLLRTQGIVGLLRAADKPRYDERVVEAYGVDQIEALFAAANAEEKLLFELFLGTGFREQEVMHTTGRNVDFRSKLISAKSKPEFGFTLKDNEERSVPVPDFLIASLAQRKKTSKSALIFPGPKDNPNGHFLRVLKRVPLHAGLNCGECCKKNGKTCAIQASCSQWGLHKFRKTFATMHSEGGVPARPFRGGSGTQFNDHTEVSRRRGPTVRADSGAGQLKLRFDQVCHALQSDRDRAVQVASTALPVARR